MRMGVRRRAFGGRALGGAVRRPFRAGAGCSGPKLLQHHLGHIWLLNWTRRKKELNLLCKLKNFKVDFLPRGDFSDFMEGIPANPHMGT